MERVQHGYITALCINNLGIGLYIKFFTINLPVHLQLLSNVKEYKQALAIFFCSRVFPASERYQTVQFRCKD